MRDLYRKLEIEKTASKEEIVAALEAHPDLAGYAAILLDEERRAAYDRVHTTLKMLGTLRFRLDLDKSDVWFIQHYRDFAIMPKPILSAGPQEPDREEKARAASNLRKKRRRRRWLYAMLAVAVLAAAVFLALTLY